MVVLAYLLAKRTPRGYKGELARNAHINLWSMHNKQGIPEMTPQPMIDRWDFITQRYISFRMRSEKTLRRERITKHQHFQLLTDLSTVIPCFRYLVLNRDCKAARRIEVQAWLASYP